MGHDVTLLTGGFDKPYALGLAMALASRNVTLDVIGSDDIDTPAFHTTAKLTFLNLFGNQQPGGVVLKMRRVILYYARLAVYAATAHAQIFHILWNGKLQFFDRTVLMMYYKLLRKKVVVTAHNVNVGRRDSNDSLLNRLTLKIQYILSDHIFVHTDHMKQDLIQEFGISDNVVSVIPFGINNSVPNTSVTPSEARQRLGIRNHEQTILFFGAIRPYKGLEYLVDAFLRLAAQRPEYRLIVAGEPRRGDEKYLEQILQRIDSDVNGSRIIKRLHYISDDDTELYFKAADVAVLPYTTIFQSGVLFLAYNFGLPVIASDVGSFRDDIVDGETGYLCRACDPDDLAISIVKYFSSDLFRNLNTHRSKISALARVRHSWDIVGNKTCAVYTHLTA